jgi:hypothetical protein
MVLRGVKTAVRHMSVNILEEADGEQHGVPSNVPCDFFFTGARTCYCSQQKIFT